MLYRLVPEKCIACGLCQVLAPEIFDYTPEGIVLFADNPTEKTMTIQPDLAEKALAAYRECPTRAIEIVK